MANFFRELASAESIILADPFTEHDDGIYSAETKAVLSRMIRAVMSGRYFPQSEASRYICQNFRLGASELTKLYNSTHDEPKQTSTFRSQISVASNKLYSLFGHGIYQKFVSQDLKKLQRLDNIITLAELADRSFADLFFDDITMGFIDESYKEHALSECAEELTFLNKLMKLRVYDEMKNLDKSKLAYLYQVLNQPLVDQNDLHINKKKAGILVTLGVPALVLENTT